MNKENKGITLVALVITIIILLILAGISISSLTGSGLFNNAKQAKTKTTQEQIKEEIKIAYNSVQIDALMYDWNNEKKAQELEKELQKQDPDAKVVASDIVLLTSYKGYEATIDSEGNITLEDDSMGEKPTGQVAILTKGSGADKVELQVTVTSEGEIDSVQPLNGAVLKTGDSRETDKIKIFEVTSNGKYYFRVIAKNGRTAILVSDEVDNILTVSESLLKAIENINTSGNHRVKVIGKTEEGEDTVTYSLNTIVYDGDLHLDGTKEVDGVYLAKINSVRYMYGIGSQNDVGTATEDAKNTVVLKVNGNLTVDENIYVTAGQSVNGYGGPKGLIIYCTGTLTNNGEISMTNGGAKAVGENVFLWKNEGGSYEYIPAVGAQGGQGKSGWSETNSSFKATGEIGGSGDARSTGGGGAGSVYALCFSATRKSYGSAGSGASGTSYSGGTGGGSSGSNAYGASSEGTSGEANGGKGGDGQRMHSWNRKSRWWGWKPRRTW